MHIEQVEDGSFLLERRFLHREARAIAIATATRIQSRVDC
jgi:hypothetical protein